MMRITLTVILLTVMAAGSLAQTPATRPAAQGIGLSRISVPHRDLEYVRRGNRPLKLDLYIPKEPAGTSYPLIVWVHGGGWKGGNKAFVPGLPFMLGRGFAVASVQYRFSQEAIFPAQIEDCRDAIRFLRTNATQYQLDPNRIGAWGGSAGGHLVALLGTMPDDPNTPSARVSAVCDFYGPTEMVRMGRFAATWVKRGQDDPVADLFGGPIEQKLDLARQASPLTFVSKDSAPFLIFQGTKDPLVPVEQSRLLADALKRTGVPAELVIFEGAGHGGPQFETQETLAKIADFFARHLK